jgi:hypothetical protein
MPQRLPLVLSTTDLPLAELGAARLDGDLYAVGPSFAPVDEIESPLHRACALRANAPPRLIAEQSCAAWIWGARTALPAHLEFCVPTGARVTHSNAGWYSVREVVIDDHEILNIGGMPVTSPIRTVLDVARWSEQFGLVEVHAIRALMRIGGFVASDCVDQFESRKSLPGKKRAIDRLSRC